MKKIHIFLLILLGTVIIGGAATQIKPGKQTAAPEQANDQNITAENPTATPTAPTSTLASFDECIAAGNEVIGEEPYRRCVVSENLAYLEIESCSAPTGEKLSFFEAQQYFNNGRCAWEGNSLEAHYCDKDKGAWVIGIQAYRKDCEAFCVIDVITKNSEVDWRCKSGK